MARHRVRQLPSQIVDVSTWAEDPDNPTYPEGKQPKRLLISPAEAPYPFLLPRHRYLFKTPVPHQNRQVWSELIAYELSRLVGLDVPPCFLAVDRRSSEVGVLSEFFYGYQGEDQFRFIPGSEPIHSTLMGDYDRKRGRPHSVRQNLTICRSLGIQNPKQWWAKAFLFDALIGNGDRHPDNWGFLSRPTGPNSFERRMAPLFDNGSSLCHGDEDRRLERLKDIEAYIRRGRHHCSWDSVADKGSPHLELCDQYMGAYFNAGLRDEFMIHFSDEAINDVLAWILSFECAIPFSVLRANFLRALLNRRRDLLIALCERHG